MKLKTSCLLLLAIVFFLCASQGILLAQTDENLVKIDVAKDIVRMFIGNKGPELFESRIGPILVADLCDKTDITSVTPLLDRLESAGIVNPELLMQTFQGIIQTGRAKLTSLADLPVSELSGHMCQAPLSGNSIYQGYKVLGEWQCDTSDPIDPDGAVSFMGIFMNDTQAVLFQPSEPDQVRVWIAPFKSAPSDALVFSFLYQENRWQICGICSSMRL